MSRTVLLFLVCHFFVIAGDGKAWAADEAAPVSADVEIDWHHDYGDAMRAARAEGKMMFVWFQGKTRNQLSERFEAVSLRDRKVRSLLDRFVSVKLPQDATITVDGEPVRLLEHAAFQEMNGGPGIAIIDFENRETEHYGYVVTTLPFTPGKFYQFRPEHLAVVLDLPPGTLTQRTLVFAVRIHPEKPASTRGTIDPTLVSAAKQHSTYQARIRLQGHHHWGERFPRLARLLGLNPQEIVAESWPQESLVDAAVDVVDSWHHSSGHWQAVYSNQRRFGYDMKKGSNGIWYATGLFGSTH
ncbi:MAG TPA: hypothetical protein VNH11_15625 [Pirellulales bacterium]|nr:hypothetical protein [Pirellulales bacterium]